MQQITKTKYSANTHIKATNGELLSHFIIFMQAKYNR